jgi:hypothetical protein
VPCRLEPISIKRSDAKGLEQPPKFSAANSGALHDGQGQQVVMAIVDSDLTFVAEVWPILSEKLKLSIMAMVNGHCSPDESSDVTKIN